MSRTLTLKEDSEEEVVDGKGPSAHAVAVATATACISGDGGEAVLLRTVLGWMWRARNRKACSAFGCG
jgi:hypothetical protein